MSEASAWETRLAGDWDHLEAPWLIPSILAGCPEGWSQLGLLTPCLPATLRVTQVSSRLGSLGVVIPLTLRIREPKLSGLYDPVLWAEYMCLPNFTCHLPGLNGWSGGRARDSGEPITLLGICCCCCFFSPLPNPRLPHPQGVARWPHLLL